MCIQGADIMIVAPTSLICVYKKYLYPILEDIYLQ